MWRAFFWSIGCIVLFDIFWELVQKRSVAIFSKDGQWISNCSFSCRIAIQWVSSSVWIVGSMYYWINISLSQQSAERGRERSRAETLRKKLNDEGWQLHDPKEHSLVLPHFSRHNLYIRLICDTSKDNIDIFLHFLSQHLLQTIWNGQIEDDPNVWVYDHSERKKRP